MFLLCCPVGIGGRTNHHGSGDFDMLQVLIRVFNINIDMFHRNRLIEVLEFFFTLQGPQSIPTLSKGHALFPHGWHSSEEYPIT